MNVQSDILMQLLKDKNMSQAQLARESGVTENTISSWKKDGHDANKSCVERVAKALGTTVKKLTTIAQGDDKKRVDQAAELELISYHYGVSTNTILRERMSISSMALLDEKYTPNVFLSNHIKLYQGKA